MNNCLTNQQEDILTEQTNLNCTWNKESVSKPYAGKQRSSHNTMSTEILMMNKTVSFHKRRWIQISVSKDSLEQNQKALTVLNTRLTPQYWVMKEKEAATNYCHALELDKSVSDKRVQQLYSQDQTQEVIDQAERQVASAR